MKKTALFWVLFTCSFLGAGDFDFISYFQGKVGAYFPEAVEVRRHLHRLPELCFQEKQTAAFVAGYLRECGLEVQTGMAGTGIKAILKGERQGPVVGIRADMDGLPIEEKTGLSFQSRNSGHMHACGHDGHMTNVLITAKILSEIKDKIPGTVVFIFQPCEEGTPDGTPSGADRMIREGVLENPKIGAMLGLHVMPGYPVGTVALREGPLMANVASVFITVNGKSGHGAFPHQGVDAVYAAALAVVQFQALISRLKDPNERAVLSIGKIDGGVRLNVIADRVVMEGTVRTFSFVAENKIEQGMENILKGLELSLGITYDFKFARSAKFVKNDASLTRLAVPLFKKLLGEENVFITEPLTIGEDFSAYSHQIPSLFFFLGARGAGKLHTPEFSIDEDIFLYGPLLFAAAAIELLNNL
jgi:amidohydrolase